MKELLNYHEPITCSLKKSYYLLTENEYKAQIKNIGEPKKISDEFPNSKPSPFRIEGEGWILEDYQGFGVTDIYLRKKTHKVIYL